MGKRQDALHVLQGKEPEYLPWFGDLAYWIDYLQTEGLVDRQYTEEGISAEKTVGNQGLAGTFCENGLQQMHRDLGVGFYLQGYFPFKTIYRDVNAVFMDDGHQRITEFSTPYGNLREVWEFIDMTYSWAPKEMLVKTEKDIKALQYVYEHTSYEADYELAVKRKETVGGNGLVLVYAPKTPLMELVALRAGIETVVDISMDAEEEFEELLEVMQKKHEEALAFVLECPADCIMVPDNLSSELVGGRFYDCYIKDIHKKWTDMIRSAEKYSFVHLDGTLTPLLAELSKAGFDVIEAVTPKPVGDVVLEELRMMTKESTIIWGGIPGGFFTDQLTDKEFDDYVIHVIKYMKVHPGFVLGVADQVVPGARPERIARVNQLIRTYGKY